MIQVDWHAYALSMHKQIPLRITKGNNSLTELAPCPYFSIINVQFVDINVFDEIPSLPVKEKPKCRGKQKIQIELR